MHIYRTLYPTAPEHTFFSSEHETFSSIDYILGHKTSLNHKKIVFSDHNGVKLEIMNGWNWK